MKKIFFLLLAVIPVLAFGQKAVITFEQTTHNFGTIGENDGLATYEFAFKNDGNAPLILTNVKASCGCTTPEWSREPLAPGQTGKIKVSYNPKNRPGSFIKSITVNSNADKPVNSLTIRGNVANKPADPYAAYSYSIGALKATSSNLNLGTVNNNQTVEKSIDIINSGDKPVKASITTPGEYITATTVPATLKKGEKGKIMIRYNAGEKNDWGFVSDKLEINTDQNAKGSIVIVANINEDFSQYKDNKDNAPVAVFSEDNANLGDLAKNTTKTHEFFIQNDGKSDLVIRKVKASDASVTATPAKTVIKPGKKIKVNVSFKTDDSTGKKTKIVAFTLNDPKNTVVSYRITGNIQ